MKKTTWRQFLRSNWSFMAAADFFTVEVLTCRGLSTYYVLFVIELSTRRVHIAGITRNPNESWMMQIAKNLTDPFDGFLRSKRKLIIDSDSKFSGAFRQLLTDSGCTLVRLPARSPNLNAYAERFVRSIKTECTNRLIFFGERSLRYAIGEYMEHYNSERPHQVIGNQPILLSETKTSPENPIECSERLGGLLRSCQRRAA